MSLLAMSTALLAASVTILQPLEDQTNTTETAFRVPLWFSLTIFAVLFILAIFLSVNYSSTFSEIYERF